MFLYFIHATITPFISPKPVLVSLLLQWWNPAIRLQDGKHVTVLNGTIPITNVSIKSITSLMRWQISWHSIAEHSEKKLIRPGGIPILSIACDGIKKLIKLLLAETASERCYEGGKVLL